MFQTWLVNTYSVEWIDGTADGEARVVLKAIDYDIGANGEITYTILSPWDTYFKMEDNLVVHEGRLELATFIRDGLIAEDERSFRFEVEMSDIGNPRNTQPLKAQVDVTVFKEI